MEKELRNAQESVVEARLKGRDMITGEYSSQSGKDYRKLAKEIVKKDIKLPRVGIT